MTSITTHTPDTLRINTVWDDDGDGVHGLELATGDGLTFLVWFDGEDAAERVAKVVDMFNDAGLTTLTFDVCQGGSND